MKATDLTEKQIWIFFNFKYFNLISRKIAEMGAAILRANEKQELDGIDKALGFGFPLPEQ